jgi:hypothetical protein
MHTASAKQALPRSTAVSFTRRWQRRAQRSTRMPARRSLVLAWGASMVRVRTRRSLVASDPQLGHVPNDAAMTD